MLKEVPTRNERLRDDMDEFRNAGVLELSVFTGACANGCTCRNHPKETDDEWLDLASVRFNQLHRQWNQMKAAAHNTLDAD